MNLAQCVVYLARAPKSNEVYRALQAAKSCVKNHQGALPSVPLHLRNAPTKLMQSLGLLLSVKYFGCFDMFAAVFMFGDDRVELSYKLPGWVTLTLPCQTLYELFYSSLLCSPKWMMSWLVGWLVGDWLIVLAGWVVGLVGWLVGWLTGWLIRWLDGWVTGWLVWWPSWLAG